MLNINNPGNLRIGHCVYVGEVVPSSNSHFREFKSMLFGYRAMFELIHHYLNHNVCTIRLIISTYAPGADHNDTNAYIKQVCYLTNLKENNSLLGATKEQLISLVCAIAFIENGVCNDVSVVQQAYCISSFFK
jgi:hypothetical protein